MTRSGRPPAPRFVVRSRLASSGQSAALVSVLVLALAACTSAAPTGTPGGATPACPKAQPALLPAGQSRTVTLQTPKGAIVIKVDGTLSPIAAGNFVALASCGYYNGVVFHRVVPQFVIQGGDGTYGREPHVDSANIGTGGPGYTIQDEPVTATYARGVVAMARSSQPNSQGSQFFIVLDDSAAQSLASANTYAIFGHVTSGMATVDAIAAAAGGQEIPVNPVPMTSVTVGP